MAVSFPWWCRTELNRCLRPLNRHVHRPFKKLRALWILSWVLWSNIMVGTTSGMVVLLLAKPWWLRLLRQWCHEIFLCGLKFFMSWRVFWSVSSFCNVAPSIWEMLIAADSLVKSKSIRETLRFCDNMLSFVRICLVARPLSWHTLVGADLSLVVRAQSALKIRSEYPASIDAFLIESAHV